MKPVLYSEGGSLEQSKYLKLYYNNGPKANYYFPSDIELRTPSIFCPMQGSAIPWKLIFFSGLTFPSFSYMENNTFIKSTLWIKLAVNFYATVPVPKELLSISNGVRRALKSFDKWLFRESLKDLKTLLCGCQHNLPAIHDYKQEWCFWCKFCRTLGNMHAVLYFKL